jgi:hypothetical protein
MTSKNKIKSLKLNISQWLFIYTMLIGYTVLPNYVVAFLHTGSTAVSCISSIRSAVLTSVWEGEPCTKFAKFRSLKFRICKRHTRTERQIWIAAWGERAVIAQSVQHWAMGWTIWVLGFDSRRGLGIFLFTTASRTALGPTQPPIQLIPVALSLGVKRPGLEADHSHPSSAEVKEWVALYLHSLVHLHGVVLS